MGEAGYRLKGATLRAYLKELARRGWLDAVKGRVPTETRLLFDAPPPSSSWMDAGAVEDVMDAILALHGEDSVRAFSHDAHRELLPFLKPVIEGMLRLFGASPATLYARMNLVTRSSIQGAEFGWSAESPNQGAIEVRFLQKKRMPRRVFISFVGTFELMLELCGKRGAVTPPEIFADGAGASYRVRWE